jgi:hypothetical protein
MRTYTAWKNRKIRDSRIDRDKHGLFVASSLVLTLLVIALFAGCAFTRSHFRPSSDVSRQFENGEIASGYRYYVSVPESKPLAIVAIRADYHMQSEHWREIDLDSASLKALVKRVSYVLGSEYKKDQMIPNGAKIFGPDGSMVGMWYSVYDYSMATFPGDKVIHLSTAPARMSPEVRIPHDN